MQFPVSARLPARPALRPHCPPGPGPGTHRLGKEKVTDRQGPAVWRRGCQVLWGPSSPSPSPGPSLSSLLCLPSLPLFSPPACPSALRLESWFCLGGNAPALAVGPSDLSHSPDTVTGPEMVCGPILAKERRGSLMGEACF